MAAPDLYQDYIKSARRKIEIWDPYIHGDDMTLFSYLTNPVAISFLTDKSSRHFTTMRDDIINKLKLMVPTHLKANVSVNIAYIDTDIHGRKWTCHDRFLIIDDTDFYLVGSSLAYQYTSQKSTGIFKLADSADMGVIRDAFDKTYNQAVSDGHVFTQANLS